MKTAPGPIWAKAKVCLNLPILITFAIISAALFPLAVVSQTPEVTGQDSDISSVLVTPAPALPDPGDDGESAPPSEEINPNQTIDEPASPVPSEVVPDQDQPSPGTEATEDPLIPEEAVQVPELGESNNYTFTCSAIDTAVGIGEQASAECTVLADPLVGEASVEVLAIQPVLTSGTGWLVELVQADGQPIVIDEAKMTPMAVLQAGGQFEFRVQLTPVGCDSSTQLNLGISLTLRGHMDRHFGIEHISPTRQIQAILNPPGVTSSVQLEMPDAMASLSFSQGGMQYVYIDVNATTSVSGCGQWQTRISISNFSEPTGSRNSVPFVESATVVDGQGNRTPVTSTSLGSSYLLDSGEVAGGNDLTTTTVHLVIAVPEDVRPGRYQSIVVVSSTASP